MFFFFKDTVESLRNVTAADIRAVGEAVYGYAWQRQMTERINALRETSGPIAATAVYGWAAGERQIPSYVAPMLASMLIKGEADLERRLQEVRALRRRVHLVPPPDVRPPRGKNSKA